VSKKQHGAPPYRQAREHDDDVNQGRSALVENETTGKEDHQKGEGSDRF